LSDDADNKAHKLITQYATKDILDHQEEQFQYTCLIKASEIGRTTVVEALIANGANVNLINKYGESALSRAAEKGFVDCARLLVEAGAELNTQTKYGWETPLDKAV